MYVADLAQLLFMTMPSEVEIRTLALDRPVQASILA
jgi:hypothetical protein